jgi:NAD(P)H-nitrite reductase large subunit
MAGGLGSQDAGNLPPWDSQFMQPDDELCLCFHVTKRKVFNYLRVEKPVRVGQLSDCFGAGTGCGWCRPFLQRMFDEARLAANQGSGPLPASSKLVQSKDEPTAAEYAARRAEYVRAGKGSPPAGATPIE